MSSQCCPPKRSAHCACASRARHSAASWAVGHLRGAAGGAGRPRVCVCQAWGGGGGDGTARRRSRQEGGQCSIQGRRRPGTKAGSRKLPATQQATLRLHPPAGDAHGLGVADKLPQPVRGDNQDVARLAGAGPAAAPLAVAPLHLLPAARLLPPPADGGRRSTLRPAALALARRARGLLLLQRRLLLPAPPVRRRGLAAGEWAAAAAAAAACAPGWQQQGDDVGGAGHTCASRQEVAEAAADCQAGHVGLWQVDPVRPSRPPLLIQQSLHHPAARLLDAGALQGAAQGKKREWVGCASGQGGMG